MWISLIKYDGYASGHLGAFVFFGFLCSIPIYIRTIITLRSPLAVDASGTKFIGHYRRWQVSTITGRVAGTNTYTTTSTKVSYESSQYHDGYDKHVTTSTQVHDTFLLVDPEGQQHSFTLTDFHLELFTNQIACVVWAVRGRKQPVITVLNLSTRRTFTSKRNLALHKVVHPHGLIFGCWLIGVILLAMVASIATGGPLALAGFLAVIVISAFISSRATNRQFRRFLDSGIEPVRANAGAVAAAL